MERQFVLPEFDEEYLNRLGVPWETVVSQGKRLGEKRWVIIHDYPLPQGYTFGSVDVALELVTTYPDTQIDMVYFRPHLALLSGESIRQLSGHQINGDVWQRWSRHRTPANPWRRGYDCIETHMLLVDEWLERENRRAA